LLPAKPRKLKRKQFYVCSKHASFVYIVAMNVWGIYHSL